MEKKSSRWFPKVEISRLHAAILALILISLILRIPILLLRCFCPDEFQHLHAARSIVHGMVPYRDFFEHHTPFLYYLLAPVYAIVGDSISMLFYSRGIMLLFTGGIIYLVYKLGKMVYGADTGWIGALFVAYNLMFMDKTIETRPDLPGMVFWLLTLIFLIQGMRLKEHRYYLLTGGSIALAILCTPKMLFGGIGLFLAAMWLLIDRRTENTLRESVGAIAWMALGVSIPAGLTCIYFGANHALDDFIYRNFTTNLQWRHSTGLGATWSFWLYNVARNPFFSVFSFTGLAIATYRLRCKHDIAKGAFVPVIATYALLGALFVIPEAYGQYFVFFLILLAVFSGLTVSTIMNRLSISALKDMISKRKLDLVVYCLIGTATIVALGYALAHSNPKLPFLSSSSGGNLCSHACYPAGDQLPYSGLIYLSVWACLLVGALSVFLHQRHSADNSNTIRRAITFLLLIGIFMYPLSEVASQVKRTNALTLKEIQFVLDNTTEDDHVIDGFHGSGVFRQHTYYYHFVHVGVRMMMTEKELSTDIVSAMRQKKPKIVVYDRDLQNTSEAVRQYVKEHYVPTGVGILHILKETALEPGKTSPPED